MTLLQIGLIILSGLPILSTALLAYQLLRNGQGAFGTPTILPWLFYPAKLLTGLLMVLLFWVSLRADFFLYFPRLIQTEILEVQKLLALIFVLAGNLLLIPAYYSMSIFTRVGLPTKDHALQTKGIYRISRNPMYTSFFFFFTACFLLIPSVAIAIIGLFCLVTHHFIILNEEKFLLKAFGTDYAEYRKNTSRYL
ncbi:methyltransferase family protein [Sunxiuqinia dokdonensis]|uniref:Isoprenylcysteine carboxylmethyltransferase family protein n=1 Tax=Sunxiuqinia dokdonensis TaxID=1409788 RepID=A0A0L8V710_9BACT|nr:isoprenylcysteine carboxylmethyltransferase family protein [Sunxiuqinia dokdonensis]KOH44221.1 hypothetical protein NC99_29420 [Sunxiuqinia dokdonensis]